MSRHVSYLCEGCGDLSPNVFATKGWLRITGSISRARGELDVSGYCTDYLPEADHDFCSISCLEKAINKAVYCEGDKDNE